MWTFQNIKIPFIPKETFTIQQNEIVSSFKPTYRQKHFNKNQNIQKKKTTVTQKDWVPQHILKDYNMYCCNAFLIRSWTEEEKIHIQNGCRFQGLVPIEYLSAHMLLEVELMYYELSNPKIASFKTIAVAKYAMQNFQNGIYEYVPIIFNDDHFHLVNTCIYVALLGFKFKGKESVNGACIQTPSMKQLYQSYVHPLRQSFLALLDFVNKLEQERKSSSTGNLLKCSQLPLGCDFKSGENLARQVATEFQIVESQINSLWMRMFQTVKQRNSNIVRPLKREQIMNQQMRFASFTHCETVNLVDHIHTIAPITNNLVDEFKLKRNKNNFQQQGQEQISYKQLFGPSKIIDMKLISEIQDQLLIMEKHYVTGKLVQDKFNSGKIHLIVFVHGYQGHPFDMRLFENYLCMRYPQNMFMISISNQNSTEGDILQMGMNLAHEITEFVNQWCADNCLQKVTFIAHSLGGLIVRACLPHLNELSDKCFSLVTLGSPHVGYAHNQHTLIKFGLWFLQTFKKSMCLTQLCLKDSKNEEDLCLMKLSKMPGLSWFKHIIMVGSRQDHYVSQESALVMKLTDQNDLHNKIAQNILRSMTQSEIIRINIDFNFENRFENQYNI